MDGVGLTLAVVGRLTSLTALSALQLSVAPQHSNPDPSVLVVSAGASSGTVGSSMPTTGVVSGISSSRSSSSGSGGGDQESSAAVSGTLCLSKLRLLHVPTQLSQAAAAWLQAECAAAGVQCVLKDTSHAAAAAAVEAAFVL
jgi:hypothetical protein